MADRGLRMAGIGLLLGIGVGVAIITIQEQGSKALMEFLGDQVKRSCDTCSFHYDSVSLSLLTLHATATNARIFDGSNEALVVKKLSGDFSLRDIWSHQIVLDELALSDVTSFGVGPKSATFKFVDFLSAPLPPEKQTPDRWRLVLKRLTVTDGDFIEKFPSLELLGNGVQLDMHRTAAGEDFALELSSEDLALRSDSLIKLGGLTAHLMLRDDYVDIEKLRLALRESTLDLSSIVWTKDHSNDLEGGAHFSFDERSLQLPRWLDIALSGAAQVGGVFSDPKFAGSFHSDRPVTLFTPDLLFSDFSGSFAAGFDKVVVDGFTAEGPGCSLHATAPLSISRSSLGGKFELHADSLSAGPVTARGVTISGSLSGSSRDPVFSLETSALSLTGPGAELADVSGTTTISKERIELTLSNREATLQAHASITTPVHGRQSVTGDITTKKLALAPHSAQTLTSAITFEGPLDDPSKISAQGPVVFTHNGLVLSGELTAHEAIDLRLSDTAQALSIHASMPNRTGTAVDISAELNSLATLLASDSCADAAMTLGYRFDAAKPTQGNGTLAIRQLLLGCRDGTLSDASIGLAKSLTLPIRSGRLSLNGLNLTGKGGELAISGEIADLNDLSVTAKADLNLQSLLGVLPQADELRGQLKADLSAHGPIGALRFGGSGTLDDAELGIESIGVHIRDGAGRVSFDGSRVILDQLTARVNEGSLSLAGIFDSSRPAGSEARLQFNQVEVVPLEGTSFFTSGDVRISAQPEKGAPLLSGTVTILEGDINRSFDVASIIRTIVREILQRQPLPNSSPRISNLDLSLTVEAPRGIVVTTNVAELELKGSILVKGTADTPILEGQIETIQGWVGLQSRQFSLTSGIVKFTKDQSEPTVDILGEALMVNRAGETVLVFLSVSGPLSSPRVAFSSDRGLSEREILDLISVGNKGSYSSEVANRPAAQGIPLVGSYSLFNFSSLLSSLTRIDSVGIEPSYNPQTGLLEPSIIARKQIVDDIALIGESFGGQTSRIRTTINLGPRLSLHVSAESDPTRRATALGADLAFSVFGGSPSQVEILVEGDTPISHNQLREALHIGSQSRIGDKDLPRLTSNLVASLVEAGYKKATAVLTCLKRTELFCTTINVGISSGPQSKIQSLTFTGDLLAGSIPERVLQRIQTRAVGAAATKALRQEIRRGLVGGLRSEGYLGARVEADYQHSEDGKTANLNITVHRGSALSFVFEGNTRFNAETFLGTLNLFERRQPFGSNTTRLLIQNIERMYREAGYLYVTISAQVEPSLEDRTIHRIHITEGNPVPVLGVHSEGNAAFTWQEIISNLQTQGFEQIENPRYAVAEQIEALRGGIERFYVGAGFSEAQVKSRIDPRDDGVEILYQIVEGKRTLIQKLTVTGWPVVLTMPPAPRSPSSIPDADRFIRDLGAALRSAGFHQARIATDATPEGDLALKISAGAPTLIGTIQIRGNARIPEEFIRERLALTPGDRWDDQTLTESKRRLLALGLFEKIEASPRDGVVDSTSEDLLVLVAEQALRTFDVGLGANSEYGLHLFGQYQERGLFLDGRTLNLRLDSYYDSAATRIDQGTASLRYAVPVLGDTPWSFAEDLRFQRQQQESFEFDLDRISVTTSVYRGYDEGLNLSFGHSLLHERLGDVTPGAILGPDDTGDVTLSLLSGALTFDGRDDALLPTHGALLTFDYRAASSLLGSDATYGGFTTKGSYLTSLSEHWSFLNSAQVAGLWTFGDTDVVPISQRLYLGGHSTVRGFRENSLGPRGFDDAVLGGERLWAASSEIHYAVTDPVELISFLDWGSLGLTSFDNDLRTSAGVGIRYRSPIGPIGFDVAHPLDEKSGEPSIRIHFAIGAGL